MLLQTRKHKTDTETLQIIKICPHTAKTSFLGPSLECNFQIQSSHDHTTRDRYSERQRGIWRQWKAKFQCPTYNNVKICIYKSWIGDQQHATSCEILPCLIFAHFIIYLDSSINSDVKNTVAAIVLVLGISRRTLTLYFYVSLISKYNKTCIFCILLSYPQQSSNLNHLFNIQPLQDLVESYDQID